MTLTRPATRKTTKGLHDRRALHRARWRLNPSDEGGLLLLWLSQAMRASKLLDTLDQRRHLRAAWRSRLSSVAFSSSSVMPLRYTYIASQSEQSPLPLSLSPQRASTHGRAVWAPRGAERSIAPRWRDTSLGAVGQAAASRPQRWRAVCRCQKELTQQG